MSGIVERLREVAMEKHQAAWGRIDGGQDLSIGAMLADEAADEIERLQAELREARLALEQIANSATSRTGEYTTGEGHAECLAIARAFLAK